MAAGPDSAPARTRRRLLSLGEAIALLALIISAAGLWDQHRQRVAEAAHAAAAARPAPAVPLVLTASVADDGAVLRLAANRDRIIQTQAIVFPAALATDRQETVGNARIEAGWFARGLRAALPGKHSRGRVPVGIITRYVDDGGTREDRALYDIGIGWRSHLIGSDTPVLEGITLVTRGGQGLQAKVDARWAAAHPQTPAP